MEMYLFEDGFGVEIGILTSRVRRKVITNAR